MRKLLEANLLRLRKTHLFWGSVLLEIAFALFRVYTSYKDTQVGYEITTDEILFTYIMAAGLITAVFTSVFLGTEYHDNTIRNKLAAGHSRTAIYFANFLTVLIACLLFTAAYIVTALAAGIPFFGFLTLKTDIILTTFLGTLATSAAFCALYTLISMSSSHKTTSAIVCILLFFFLLCASTYVAAMLDAPEEHTVIEMVNGELVSHMAPNPKYLQGTKREVYQFFFDFLPTGQATQYVVMSAKPLLMSLYSVLTAAAASLGGIAYFRRKDIK